MLKILICDDDERDLQHMQELAEEFQKKHEEEMEITAITSSAKLLEQLKRGKVYDIYILDIMMDELDGIGVGHKIREYGQESCIIYVSTTPEFAMGALGVYANGYLVKPVSWERFEPCMDFAVKKAGGIEPLTYALRAREGMMNVEIADITRVENISRILHFHLSDGSCIQSMYLRRAIEEELAPLLQEGYFVQPHKSFVINMNFVDRIELHDFVMTDGTVIPISRHNLAEVKRRYLEFLSRDAWD